MPVERNHLRCVKQAVGGSRLRPLSELGVPDQIHGCIVLQPEGGTPFHNFGYWNPNEA